MDIPDRLITLQRNADAERAKLAGLIGDEREAQWKRWYEAAVEIQAAVTAHARETGTPRNQIEAAAKKVVRHPEPED
ncbi:hypothetical protein [Streptomyces sp. ME19-01-6]|uniref:hypothetical protein n=1 Tax=Streptomyces sp. ME19-01-6 TaxID=3028686 RepID=UPI0029B08DE2|nr:hypothetical protein [Streptomyces sp. ME19-01-6]MDX3229816.1 hypothetical protein [Streptomyces sp. ME19-01-6]